MSRGSRERRRERRLADGLPTGHGHDRAGAIMIGDRWFCVVEGREVVRRWYHERPHGRWKHVGSPFPPTALGC